MSDNPRVSAVMSAELERQALASRFAALTEPQKIGAANFLVGYFVESFRWGNPVTPEHALRCAIGNEEGKKP